MLRFNYSIKGNLPKNLRYYGMIFISLIAFIFTQNTSKADEPAPIELKFSGFIKTDFFYDTRQTVNLREGHFTLYPAPEKLDINGDDINDAPALNILSIQTRATLFIKGPDVLGAKSSALLEGAFFGATNDNINTFRLRHAFLKLDWENQSILAGQFWHPMFIHENFPGVVSFNTGAPFMPFSRNPQLRFTQRFDALSLSLTAYAQRDFASPGPNGFVSDYLRNSAMPGLNAQLQYKSPSFMIGAGANYITLTPEIVTQKNLKADEKISSMAAFGYIMAKASGISFKAMGTFGQNLADLLMMGGYAVKSHDTSNGVKTYTNLSSLNLWGEISTGSKTELAVFFGFAKNLGAEDNVVGAIYGRATNIETLLRISPRIIHNIEKFRAALEFEYLAADYGTNDLADKAKVKNTKQMTNIRALLALYYFF